MSGVAREPVVLDGASLTVAALVRVARDAGQVALDPAARERNAAAAAAIAELVAADAPIYGASTGVGALSGRALAKPEIGENSLRLLRSHAAGGGRTLVRDEVRAAMAARANQIAAGGAGITPALLDGLVDALNADRVPAVHELGSLGTGDLTALAEVALAVLGDASPAIRLAPRDGLAFMSSNAVTAGRAALLADDAGRLLAGALEVAALSFEAIGADPVVFDERVHRGPRAPGAAAVAARMRFLLAGAPGARAGRIQYPFPFRVQPQVDGVAHDALAALERAATAELNLAGENALVVAADLAALPNGNFDAAALAAAIDALRGALAQSASLTASRISALLDPNLSGLPAFLAREPGPDSGAMMLEYTAHEAAAEVRSLALPVAAQWVTVARGIESHGSLAPVALRRAGEALAAMRVLVATELVIAVRGLRLQRRGSASPLFERAAAVLDADLADRPLHPDVTAATALIERWPAVA